MFYTLYNSPLGIITLASDQQGLRELHFEEDRHFAGVQDTWVKDAEQAILVQTCRQLDEYFAGKRQMFDIPISHQGTAFQQQVWQYLQNIPMGSTVSYADIASALGRPAAMRAVGTAVGRNRMSIVVPCHRVLGSNKRLAGYVAGLPRKKFLLDLEHAAYKE